jgi:MFS family permease
MSSLIVSMYFTYITMNFKLIFLPLINDDHFLTYLSIVYSIAGMGGTFLWGYIGDKKGIKFTLLFLTVLDCLFKLSVAEVQGKVSFTLFYFGLGILDKGMVTIIAPGLV